MKNKKMFWMAMSLGLVLVSGCAKSTSSDGEATPSIDAPPVQKEYLDYGSLPWESEKPVAKGWSNYLYSVIDKEAPDLINGTQDMDSFCPSYSKLLRAEKIHFWAQLIAQISKYESRYNPTLRFQEKGRTDAITGQELFSEGLLQLSYQDRQMMPKCEFDWSSDRGFAGTDNRKTIFSPYRNLRCGVLILNRQVNRVDRIAIGSGAYWAVIKSDSPYSKLPAIRSALQALTICQR